MMRVKSCAYILGLEPAIDELSHGILNCDVHFLCILLGTPPWFLVYVFFSKLGQSEAILIWTSFKQKVNSCQACFVVFWNANASDERCLLHTTIKL